MKMKKVLVLLMAIVMVIGLMPITATAADSPQLVMCWMDWVDGKPTASDGYFVDSQIDVYRQNTLYPALLQDGKLTMLDPADLYSEDDTALSVQPSTRYEGALTLEAHTVADTQILYDHTDGKTYGYSVSSQLPDIAFYSAPEAALEHYITDFTANNDNDTVYLISQSDLPIEDLQPEGFPEGTTFEISVDKKMAAIAIGHAAVQAPHVSVTITTMNPDGSRREFSGPYLNLSTDFSGLYFRHANFIELDTPTENPTYARETSFDATKGNTYTLFFHFFDGSKETRLTANQLRAEDNRIITITDFGNGSDAVNITLQGFGETAIIYEHNGISYRLPVSIELPSFGFYTEPVLSEETFIPGIFSLTDDSRTVYLMIGDSLPTYRITDARFDVPDSMHINKGSFEISDDGRRVAITIEDMALPGMYCAVEIGLLNTENGETSRRTENLTVEDTSSPTYNPFTDVINGDWFYKPVMWAVENGITGGLTPTIFGPDASCTRAQVVTFLYAAAGKPEISTTDNPFEDVSETDWFYKPVMWAVENGITGGLTATTFGPNATCTRAQVVTFLYAAAGKPEMGAADSPFTDVMSGDWYLNPVLWAVEKGVTSGLTPTTFGPNNTCTRAQVVTFLYANETK